MEIVYYEKTVCRVFSVKENVFGEPIFLIFFNNRWKWVHSNFCVPIEEEI